MRTTIDIPEEALREAMRFTKSKTKKEAVLAALEEFNQRRRMAELIAFSGTCTELIGFEELMELRERELPKKARLHAK